MAETAHALKASKEVHAIELFEEISNWADAELISALVRQVTGWWAGNLIVTNVPGPSFPLNLLGARLLECYPFVPMRPFVVMGATMTVPILWQSGQV